MTEYSWLSEMSSGATSLEQDGARQQGNLVFFPGINISFSTNAHLAEAKRLLKAEDISDSFLTHYESETWRLLVQLSRSMDAPSFYSVSNGLRHTERKISVFGIWTNSLSKKLWKCTDLLAANLLERQSNRGSGEIYLGTCLDGELQAFVSQDGNKLVLRKSGSKDIVGECSSMKEFVLLYGQ